MNPHHTKFETLAIRFTKWVGSTSSIYIHTLLFILSFSTLLIGVHIDVILLVLTTAVSLEAIYLAIFIQMSVNEQRESIQEVEEDIDEIQEDIDEIQEGVVEISEDIDEMQYEEEDPVQGEAATINRIHEDLKRLVEDIEKLKTQTKV